jgi:lipopolysaccharide/colanic/teichoic acid biosynthesis glycosyltransferase
MFLKRWDELPDEMRNESVRKYYDILQKKRFQLVLKRLFDIIMAFIALIILFPVIIAIAIIIKTDSKGPVMFRQVRVTQYGKRYRIYKFRTMTPNAEDMGTQVTTQNDIRITQAGRILRKYRLDEIPQLFNIIFTGDMTFVGTRPEVVKYAEQYTDEMAATLLLPAGVTSEASIKYKDEEKLLTAAKEIQPAKILAAVGAATAEDDFSDYEEQQPLPVSESADIVYVRDILPEKMRYNLEAIEQFSLLNDIKTIVRTVAAVFGKDEK